MICNEGIERYKEAIKASGEIIIPCMNKAEKLQGFLFDIDKYNLIGSEVHRQMSMGNIAKQLDKNNQRYH